MAQRSVVSPAVREVAVGIGFTEGPVWTADGRLVVTSVTRGVLYEVAPDGSGARALAETGGGPNGLAEGADGVLWVAQNGGVIVQSRSERKVRPSVQRVVGEAVEDVLVDGFTAPNDCVVGPDGRLWFTDPRAPGGEETPGRVWVYDPAGGEAKVVAGDIPFPNGLAFLPGGDELLVADSDTRRILRFRQTANGLGPAQVFAELEKDAPDGLAVDAEGRTYVAATSADAVVVLDPDGSVGRVLDLGGPSMPTNVCFGGPDLATLFVTAAKGGRVLALDGHFPGARPSPWTAS